jgi:energy-coupling factor transporter ATP-binding protein EcfA2
MDTLSKILMAVDAIKSQFFSKNKTHADDYYEVVSAINDTSLKLNDGGMISFFQLKGFSRTLNDAEKKATSKKIEQELIGYISKPGFTIQIVEISDPELTKQKAFNSMSESIDELGRMGIGHPVLTTDYVDFIASKSVWKEQFLVVYTSLEAVASRDMPKPDKEKEKEMEDKTLIVKQLLKTGSKCQGLFLTDIEKEVLGIHNDMCREVFSVLSLNNSIISKMQVDDAIKTQKKALYGNAVDENWAPSLSNIFISKGPLAGDSRVRTQEASLVEQVISMGGTEENLPPEFLSFGERYFTTISLVIPQDNEERLQSYKALAAKLPSDVGYMTSYRMVTDPFSVGHYKVEKFYTGLSAILPFTDNLLIRRARTEFESQCENKDKVGVFLEMTITLYSKELDKVRSARNRTLNSVESWGGAQFRSVELDKTQGLFDTLPGMSKESNLKSVFESFAACLYQSPLFTDGILYESGYLHFFTEEGQPFPLEEHSPLNINFNAYITGTSGSGKSTILTLLNLALMAKPKLNPKLRGEFPVIFDVDFGKTSFGFKDTIRSLVGSKKRNMFLMHEMTTSAESAVNPHDLPFGRLSPTQRHKEMLSRFILVLISGIKESKKGFDLMYPEMEGIIKYMIDTVYDECREENDPKMFESAEFKHTATLKYMDEQKILYTADYSYYHLSDLIMEKDPKGGLTHAMLIRRYGYPRLGDYTRILTERSEIAKRFSTGVIARGLNAKDFFVERMGEISNEYPCFTRVTKINIDAARMISIDIKNVCGENDHRKAIFASLCLMMFMVKRENDEESSDLMDDVAPVYHNYLKRLSTMNRVLPAALNVEEAHVLFSLFDSSMVKSQRENRKANWGLRTLSQNLQDPTDEFFSLCSMVIIASEQTGDESESRMKTMNTTRQESHLIREKLNNRRIFAYIKTKPSTNGVNVSRIAVPLKAWFSPGLIWASNSDQTDINFKKEVVNMLGPDVGLRRLSLFFKSGNVKGLLADKGRLNKLAKENRFDSVHAYLIHEITTRDTPSEFLEALL